MSRTSAVLLLAALVAYAVLAYGYVTLTPPWQNPDEPAHFNYVAFVATTGGLPVLQPGDWDSALLERLKTGTLPSTDSVSQIRYESWQPPLFYVVAAPVYLLGPPDQSLYRLRALGAVFGALTLVLAYAVARSVLIEPLAAAVPLAITGVPMFTAVSASLSADPLASLLAAATLLVLVRRLRRRVPPVAIGALLCLGLLTKLELAIFVPLAIAVVFFAASAKWRETVTLLATAAILMLPWLVHQVTSYGWTDPFAISRHSQVVTDQPRFPGFSLDWLQQLATITFHSFWAQFGWMAIVAPDRLYWIWGAIALLAVVGLIINRVWFREPAVQLLAATVVIAAIAYVGYNLSFVQFQGRYLFTAILPIGVLLVGGWNAFPPRPWSSVALAAALVAMNAYALVRVLVPGFAPPT